jgi:hypothetical protein
LPPGRSWPKLHLIASRSSAKRNRCFS